ncbi:mannose-6-phosphate isomerase, class I [Tessaracoccus sp. ZS01]|uniref:mannose-6-phosphate isomerase, class I n=1 Tax=Tessaracoccus sp. ZS01 TaxID=1906324 RepID=UPI00096C3F9B|nr:mannose-6-phosphate isomerase, class I [Tessaracoccus sp. ZS01]MCG6568586.1 mannose-6-phosphate isomerase, class I [Tessaracoccus sp. ZS01]OMG52256.1 mannose-6-phosphate isomerase, class I [Tessaracoccus sp. ZS01]
MRRLTGHVQHFAWGSHTAIPRILRREPDDRPWAEYWLGTHPGGHAFLDDGVALATHVQENPEVVGAAARAEFGDRLPYLIKILAASSPLSLQAHPSREQAEVGYARESLLGLHPSEPIRSFKDDWPKPEAIVALTPFEGLLGFRDPHETAGLFEALGVADELASVIGPLRDRAAAPALQEVFLDVLSLDERRHLVDVVLAAGVNLLEAPGALGEFARTAVELDEHFPGDPGILAALLMNRFTLQPGEAVALEPGIMHAYLRGVGVEIMASSDNVMRGGLTQKHIDVDGLLQVVRFETQHPNILVAEGADGIYVYPTSFPEFELWLVSPIDGSHLAVPRSDCGRIALVTAGIFVLQGDHGDLRLESGDSAFLAADEYVTVHGEGQMFVAASGA